MLRSHFSMVFSMVDSGDSPNCPDPAHWGPPQEENDRLRQIVENLRREVSALRLTEKGLQNLQSRREVSATRLGGVHFMVPQNGGV